MGYGLPVTGYRLVRKNAQTAKIFARVRFFVYLCAKLDYTLAPKPNAKYTGGYSINTIEKAFRGIVLDQPLCHLLVENPEEREELKQILIGQI